MIAWIKKPEALRVLALTFAAAISLSACTASPHTQLSWNADDQGSVSDGRTFYGPRNVKLPPIEQHRLAPPLSTHQAQANNASYTQPKPRNTPGWYATEPSQPVQPTSRSNDSSPVQATDAKFVWPLKGRVILGYGAGEGGERNDGINIAAVQGTPVRAAASGRISYCGNELKGYGNLVLIKHDNGYITAYAHVDSFVVGRDDHVVAGQVIAHVGSTGDVASPQLHFEIRRGVQPINPQALLPKSMVVASN